MRPTINQSVNLKRGDFLTVTVTRDAHAKSSGHTIELLTLGSWIVLMNLTEGQLATIETAIAQYRRDLHTPLEMDVPGGDDTARLSEITREALAQDRDDQDAATLASENQ